MKSFFITLRKCHGISSVFFFQNFCICLVSNSEDVKQSIKKITEKRTNASVQFMEKVLRIIECVKRSLQSFGMEMPDLTTL